MIISCNSLSPAQMIASTEQGMQPAGISQQIQMCCKSPLLPMWEEEHGASSWWQGRRTLLNLPDMPSSRQPKSELYSLASSINF